MHRDKQIISIQPFGKCSELLTEARSERVGSFVSRAGVPIQLSMNISLPPGGIFFHRGPVPIGDGI